MNLSFVIPFQRAWGRMERMLFRPFRIETWFVLGFAAFLSDYLSGGMSGSYSSRGRHREATGEVLHRVWEFISNPAMLALVLACLTTVLIAVIVVQWVSCRGRFIFLDNIVHERPGIVEPWKRFVREGNSLFAWTLVFWLVCITAAVVIALPFLATLRLMFVGGEFHWPGLAALAGLIVMSIPVALAGFYTVLFLNHFVVPIMYRHGLSATAAWGRFLPLLGKHPWYFIGYGLLMLVLWSLVQAAKIIVGISTCCVGFILLGLPYMSSVVLLPVLALFRGLGPDFLAQFGAEFDAFAVVAAQPAPIPPSPGTGAPA